MHGWYDVVAFLDSDNDRKLACWLGPTEDYGGGDVRSTVWSLILEDKADKREEIESLLKSIDKKIGNDRTNNEVFAGLGADALPQVEILGDVNEVVG